MAIHFLFQSLISRQIFPPLPSTKNKRQFKYKKGYHMSAEIKSKLKLTSLLLFCLNHKKRLIISTRSPSVLQTANNMWPQLSSNNLTYPVIFYFIGFVVLFAAFFGIILSIFTCFASVWLLFLYRRGHIVLFVIWSPDEDPVMETCRLFS